MAENTTGSKVRKTPVSDKAAKSQNTEPAAAAAAAEVAPEPTQKSYKVKKNLDPNIIVTVKNGFNGTLVYKSKKTGERFVWDGFGSEQDMELQELKSAKNSCKAFFVNNWFLFDDPEVIEYLGMGQYYKHVLNTKAFDELFTKPPEEIEEVISTLSAGQKKSMAFRAKQMIQEGSIDSIKVINALEKSLSIELIER